MPLPLEVVAAGPGEETMYTSASRGLPARVPTQDPEPKEVLGLGQLSSELLVMVLSHVPQHMPLGHCLQVCWHWHDLVDCQALWLRILAQGHATLSPILHTYLPPPTTPGPVSWAASARADP